MARSESFRRGSRAPEMELLAPRERTGRHCRIQRNRAPVEDAEFETVFPGSDTGVPEGVQAPFVWPEERSFPDERMTARSCDGGLDFFSRKAGPAARRVAGSPLAGTAFLGAVVVVAAATFWVAGGYALTGSPVSRAVDPRTTASLPPVSDDVRPMIRPMTKAAGEARLEQPAPLPVVEIKPGYSAVVERPARIERAGSILMIRSGS